MTTTSFNSTEKSSPWRSNDRSLDAFVATSWPWPWQWTWPWQWNFQHFVIFQFAQNNADAGDDTAVFLPKNFLSSFVAECVVYSYDELIRDRQSCFKEEKDLVDLPMSNLWIMWGLNFNIHTISCSFSKHIGQLTCQLVLKISLIRTRTEPQNQGSLDHHTMPFNIFCQPLEQAAMPIPEVMGLDLNHLEICNR